jgi:hypothetical protein
MKIQTQLFVIALTGIFASCGTVSSSDTTNSSVAGDLLSAGVSTPDGVPTASYAPAPSGEMAKAAPTETYDVSQIVVVGPTKVVAGLFVGDLVLDQKRSKVTGAGPGVTVIDGNLIVGDQCSVVGMTVTGDVIFRGNNSRVFVDCLGQVLDYGMQNQH